MCLQAQKQAQTTVVWYDAIVMGVRTVPTTRAARHALSGTAQFSSAWGLHGASTRHLDRQESKAVQDSVPSVTHVHGVPVMDNGNIVSLRVRVCHRMSVCYEAVVAHPAVPPQVKSSGAREFLHVRLKILSSTVNTADNALAIIARAQTMALRAAKATFKGHTAHRSAIATAGAGVRGVELSPRGSSPRQQPGVSAPPVLLHPLTGKLMFAPPVSLAPMPAKLAPRARSDDSGGAIAYVPFCETTALSVCEKTQHLCCPDHLVHTHSVLSVVSTCGLLQVVS